MPSASPARDQSDFEMADVSNIEESPGRQNQGFMDISSMADAIYEISKTDQGDQSQCCSIQSLLELCPETDDEESDPGESS